MIRPERFATDGKVFGRRRSLASIGAVRSVAVLIDASGSMRFSTTDLSNILATAPAATVATYAAPGPRSSDWALVRVWSKDGAVADETEIKKAHYYEGPRNTVLPLYENRIDGPALAWLADLQAKIKVWYTDTHVTDNSAGFSPRLQNACIQFCEDHDIRIARRDYGQSLDECLRASTWNPGV